MPAQYSEHAPPAGLERWVECLWSGSATEPVPNRPVRPDGCIDLVFARELGLRAVGAMTVQRCFDMPANSFTVGIRFRPGMAAAFLGIPAAELTDTTAPFVGKGAAAIARRLSATDSSGECLPILAAFLTAPSAPPAPVQLAIEAMTSMRGQANLDWIAGQANLSVRQFRRRCLEESGLTPRHLCRILRFRHASNRAFASRTPDWAAIAADCGYYDQAHLIRDFREFTGATPMSVFSNTRLLQAG